MTNEEFIKSVSLEGEIWKDAVGYEGYYLISNVGRVISLPRKVQNHTGYRLSKIRILSPRLNSGGYYQVAFCIDGLRTQPHIHKLVAEAFIPNPNNYPQADHIDCIKVNNCASNLRWCTQAMNNANPITMQRYLASRKRAGEKISKSNSIPVVRINPHDSTDIKIYQSATCAAKEDGFCQSSISATCLKKRPQYRGYLWMFLSDYEALNQ